MGEDIIKLCSNGEMMVGSRGIEEAKEKGFVRSIETKPDNIVNLGRVYFY